MAYQITGRRNLATSGGFKKTQGCTSGLSSREPPEHPHYPMAPASKTQDPETAIVSTARLSINAPASKVFNTLVEVNKWRAWRERGQSWTELGVKTGDTFAYQAGPNRVKATVTDVQQPKVFSWTDRALFGLVYARKSVKLEQQGGVLGLGAKRTQVTLREELAGPFRWAVKAGSLETQHAAFLKELQKACED
ncbi:hypothetical protein WJX72_010884 [[Myrmecia] bisecta]|uniref:Uncharacterized protein n=1 Tax=[Myrmecia] bisecta TaxID=41462 RepID=A0AAW1PJ22_9CHLO